MAVNKGSNLSEAPDLAKSIVFLQEPFLPARHHILMRPFILVPTKPGDLLRTEVFTEYLKVVVDQFVENNYLLILNLECPGKILKLSNMDRGDMLEISNFKRIVLKKIKL